MMVNLNQHDMMEMCLSHNRLRRIATSQLGRAPTSDAMDPAAPPEMPEILRRIKLVAEEMEELGESHASEG